MRLAVFTDALAHRPLGDALDWIRAEVPDVEAVEIGTGAFSPAPHCDLTSVLGDERARRDWLAGFEARDLAIAAYNVSGNPLHPDPAWARRDDAALRDTIRLAALTGVDRIVAMSGCPAGAPGPAPTPHFAGGGWLPDFENVLDFQWQQSVLPYWRELSDFAAQEHPELQICFELHPGACVYNGPTYDWIREAGDNLRINLDPSHFFWQGIDALRFAAHYGDRVGFVHGKDTRLMDDNLALAGVLDNRSPGPAEQLAWNFVTVGHAHDPEWWARFVATLAAAGFDGTISIEYEDPFVGPEESIAEGIGHLAAGLRAVSRA
jgi:sugar phosphate isomerase/epimerase